MFSAPLRIEKDKAVGDEIKILSGIPQFNCKESSFPTFFFFEMMEYFNCHPSI